MEEVGFVLRGLVRLLLYAAGIAMNVVGIAYTFGSLEVRLRVEHALVNSIESVTDVLRNPVDTAVDELGLRSPRLAVTIERPDADADK